MNDLKLPLSFCNGLMPSMDYQFKDENVLYFGQVVNQQIINNFVGNPDKFFIEVRPEPNLSHRVMRNIRLKENEAFLEEEKDLERVVVQLKAGEEVFAQGSEDHLFYVLVEGSVEVVKNGNVIAEICEKGSMLGELSAILKVKRRATIRAVTEVKLYRVDSFNMMSFAKNYPTFLLRICRSLADRLASVNLILKNRKQTSKLEEISDENRSDIFKMNSSVSLSSLFEEKVMIIEEGTALFNENDTSFEMYILKSGQLQVTIGGKEIALITKPEEFIGEMAILRGEKRSATIKALVRSEVSVVNGVRMLERCKEAPEILIRLTEILSFRLIQTTKQFSNLKQV